MKLSEVLEMFFKDRRGRGCGVHALAAYHQHCTLFARWLEEVGVSEVEDMNAQHIEDYIESLRTRDQFGRRQGKLSPVTIHKRMKHLRTFFLWLSEKGFISKDLVYSFTMPKTRRRLPKALSPEQVKTLLSAKMSSRDKAIIYLILDSGLRLAESAGLIVSDIDLTRGMARVRHGKGDKERYVLFGSNTAECLRVWLAARRSQTEFVFVDKGGVPLEAGGVYKIIKRVGKSVGLNIHPHELRHTFATEFLDAGGAITDLQMLMGHEQLSTTTIYTSVALGRLRERFAGGLSLINRFSEKDEED